MSEKKLIKRCKSGDTVEKSDNTRVQMPRTDVEPIYYEPAAIAERTARKQPQVGSLTSIYPEFELLMGLRGAWTSGLLDDINWFVRHPRAKKVYHGSSSKFDLRDARTASEDNVGIHVTPKKEVAKSFAIGPDGVINEAYIPGHNMTTVDIWSNDASLLSNNLKRVAMNYTDDATYTGYHDGNEDWFKLFEKYGAEPKWRDLGDGRRGIETMKDVTIPLRDETMKLSKKAQQQADDIVSRHAEAYTNRNYDEVTKINEEAAKFLSDNGKKVIKYHNIEPSEGGGGLSYIVTDPSVFYVPQYSGQFIPIGFSPILSGE